MHPVFGLWVYLLDGFTFNDWILKLLRKPNKVKPGLFWFGFWNKQATLLITCIRINAPLELPREWSIKGVINFTIIVVFWNDFNSELIVLISKTFEHWSVFVLDAILGYLLCHTDWVTSKWWKAKGVTFNPMAQCFLNDSSDILRLSQ